MPKMKTSDRQQKLWGEHYQLKLYHGARRPGVVFAGVEVVL